MKEGILLVVSGPAGSGKGTVTKMLMESGEFAFSVSATTRKPRPHEVNGEHYWFISTEEFQERIAKGEMLEYTNYCGNFYGTPKKEALEVLASGKNLILEIEVEGGLNVKKVFPNAVLIMLLPPSSKVQEERLRGRGTETEEVIQKRLLRAREELACIPQYDYVVYNYDKGAMNCANDILNIIHVESLKTERQPEAGADFFADAN